MDTKEITDKQRAAYRKGAATHMALSGTPKEEIRPRLDILEARMNSRDKKAQELTQIIADTAKAVKAG